MKCQKNKFCSCGECKLNMTLNFPYAPCVGRDGVTEGNLDEITKKWESRQAEIDAARKLRSAISNRVHERRF